jgi:GNAT superfamily N-acetyltransferase
MTAIRGRNRNKFMNYRKATSDDVPLLIELRIEFLIEANGKAFNFEDRLKGDISRYFYQHIPDESFIAWLCIHDNEIIGTSGISFYELPPSYNNPVGKVGYIMNMYTKKPFRRKGIASALFEKMLEEGMKKNIGKFVLNATKDGRGLYDKYAFISTGDEMILPIEVYP